MTKKKSRSRKAMTSTTMMKNLIILEKTSITSTTCTRAGRRRSVDRLELTRPVASKRSSQARTAMRNALWNSPGLAQFATRIARTWEVADHLLSRLPYLSYPSYRMTSYLLRTRDWEHTKTANSVTKRKLSLEALASPSKTRRTLTCGMGCTTLRAH